MLRLLMLSLVFALSLGVPHAAKAERNLPLAVVDIALVRPVAMVVSLASTAVYTGAFLHDGRLGRSRARHGGDSVVVHGGATGGRLHALLRARPLAPPPLAGMRATPASSAGNFAPPAGQAGYDPTSFVGVCP
jgi:hypothetical protein